MSRANPTAGVGGGTAIIRHDIGKMMRCHVGFGDRPVMVGRSSVGQAAPPLLLRNAWRRWLPLRIPAISEVRFVGFPADGILLAAQRKPSRGLRLTTT
jgi:hypothetical protein